MNLLARLTFAFVVTFFLTLFGRAADHPTTAIRVVSQTVGTDEILLALAEPNQVASLSHLSRESIFSAIAEEAKAYPQLSRQGDAESILRCSPTLVLFTNYSRAELVAQVKRAGVPVLIFSHYETLDDAYANLRMLGHEIGAEAQAERVIADCEKRVHNLEERLRGVTPVRVIAPSTYGVIPGDQTTFQDLCDHAGATNLGATLGKLHGHAAPPNEQMLTWPIDRLVVAGETLDAALEPLLRLPPYQYMAALKERRAVLLQPYQLSCISHLRINGYEQLARALHPEVFK